MNRNAEQVFKGFLNLTDEEKSLLVDLINNYYREETFIKRKQMQESYNKRVDLGPISSNHCACCGR
ncbi:MAG: hypothetical protein V9G20_15925 [Candidatus Promineifilaceae bacterium]